MPEQMPQSEFELLIQEYLEGSLSPQNCIRMSQFLEVNPRQAALILEELRLDGLVRETLKNQSDDELVAAAPAARRPAGIGSGLRSGIGSDTRSAAGSGTRSAIKARRTRSSTKRITKKGAPAFWLSNRAGMAACVAGALLLGALWLYMGQASTSATVSSTSGEITVRRGDATRTASAGEELFAGDTVVVADGGSCEIEFADKTQVQLHSNATLKLEQLDGGKRLFLSSGTLSAEVAKQPEGAPMIFGSSRAEAVVLGTRLNFSVEEESTRLQVKEGKVRMIQKQSNASVLVSTSQYAISGAGVDMQAREVLIPNVTTPDVVYVNDSPWTGYADEYLMALASAGEIHLRGMVSSLLPNEDLRQTARHRAQMVLLARQSGLHNIPEAILGASRPLARPNSASIDDTYPADSDGARLILAEARHATRMQPLIVLAAGALTDVASAYLKDRSIAESIVVAATCNDAKSMGGMGDPWAARIVLDRLPLVLLPNTLAPADVPSARLKEMPDGPLRDFMHWKASLGNPSGKKENDSSGQSAVVLMRPDFVQSVRRVSFAGFDGSGGLLLRDDSSGRARAVTKANPQISTREFWRALRNRAAYSTQ